MKRRVDGDGTFTTGSIKELSEFERHIKCHRPPTEEMTMREMTKTEVDAACALCSAQWFAADANEPGTHSPRSGPADNSCRACRAAIVRLIDAPVAVGSEQYVTDAVRDKVISTLGGIRRGTTVTLPDGQREMGDAHIGVDLFTAIIRVARAVAAGSEPDSAGEARYSGEDVQRMLGLTFGPIIAKIAGLVHAPAPTGEDARSLKALTDYGERVADLVLLSLSLNAADAAKWRAVEAKINDPREIDGILRTLSARLPGQEPTHG
jgi:hypothetical protein